MEEENDPDIINDVARVVGVLGDKNRKPSAPTRDRNVRKEQWTELYNQKSDEEFSEKMRINHTKFNLLLNTLWAGLNTNQLCAGANILGFRKNRDAYFSIRQFAL